MPSHSAGYRSHHLYNTSFVQVTKFFLLIVSLTVIGCQGSGSGDAQSDVDLDWEIEPDPPGVGMATINITLRDSTDQLIEGAEIALEGNMTHPGMKPTFAVAEEVESGKYSADVEFTMGGDWFFLVESTLPDNSIVERQINVPGVRSE